MLSFLNFLLYVGACIWVDHYMYVGLLMFVLLDRSIDQLDFINSLLVLIFCSDSLVTVL